VAHLKAFFHRPIGDVTLPSFRLPDSPTRRGEQGERTKELITLKHLFTFAMMSGRFSRRITRTDSENQGAEGPRCRAHSTPHPEQSAAC